MRVLWWLIGGGGTLAALGLAAVAIGGGGGSAPVSAGNPGERRIALMNSLKDAPRDFETRRKLAETFLKLADGVGAEAEIRRAMADGLPRARGAHILAHALLLQDDPRDAIAAADTPGMARADAVYAARIRGRAQMALEDQDAAAVEFNRALALAPNDSIVWSDIGRFRMLTGDMAGAGTAADKAVAIDRNNIEALILKGELVRAFGYVGQTGEVTSWHGEPGPAERDAGLPAELGEETTVLVDEKDVLKVADAWSIDPTTLTGRPATGPLRLGAI